ALLATPFHVHTGRSCLGIGPVVERRQPVLVLAVRLFHAVELHAVAVVAWSTAELIRIMNPEQLWVGVAHKRTLTAHVLCRDLNRLADTEMAGLAAVHHPKVRIVDLLDGDVHGPSLVNQTLDLLRRKAVQVLLKVGILLGPKLGNGTKNLALAHEQ